MKCWKHSFKINRQSGFTLAEVLITLGIIGVVASITIPTLLANKVKQETIAKLQKVYTNLAQALKLSEQDNGPNSTWDWGFGGTLTPRQSFDIYWAPYLKVMKYCVNSPSAECGYGTVTAYKTLTGVDNATIVWPLARTTALLHDGSLITVSAAQGSPMAVDKTIRVDINAGNGPNMYGKDVFMFILDPQKGVMPYGYDLGTTIINNDCKTGSNGGSYCAAKIIRDGWQMLSDYPW